MFVPGIKNVISMTLLPAVVVNSRCSENALNSFVYVALTFPNLTGTPLATLELTANGCAIVPSKKGPAVDVNITPRGLLKLKKSGVSELGADAPSPTPSQLISRLPEANV